MVASRFVILVGLFMPCGIDLKFVVKILNTSSFPLILLLQTCPNIIETFKHFLANSCDTTSVKKTILAYYYGGAYSLILHKRFGFQVLAPLRDYT